MDVRKIKISPEVLKFDISGVTWSGYSFGYYSPMPDILSGGTGGSSLLTDLSIPVLLTQDYQDVGYYSPFDGDLSQLSEDLNFTFKKGILNLRQICVYNTSNTKVKYLKDTDFFISWGDNSPLQPFPKTFSQFCHVYPNSNINRRYFITITGQTTLGMLSISKLVVVPYTNVSLTNPYGTVSFANNNGSWANTPSSQKYIFSGDAANSIYDQITENFIPVPYILTGNTTSRLSELYVYGAQKIKLNVVVNLKDGTTGVTNSISSGPGGFTGYTINGMDYLDFPDGKSIFVLETFGITEDMLVESAITKFDYLMNIINSAEIQSNVFIERGKNSGTENFRRIGEVGSTGELATYGYRFFDLRFYNDI
jgi:hypothetical protein